MVTFGAAEVRIAHFHRVLDRYLAAEPGEAT
jgi:hypothetical protein